MPAEKVTCPNCDTGFYIWEDDQKKGPPWYCFKCRAVEPITVDEILDIHDLWKEENCLTEEESLAKVKTWLERLRLSTEN